METINRNARGQYLTHAPAANTAATKTISGVANYRIVINRLIVSYSGTAVPTTANIVVTEAGTNNIDVDLSRLDAYDVIKGENDAYQAADGEDVTVTAAAGGANTEAKITIRYYYELG